MSRRRRRLQHAHGKQEDPMPVYVYRNLVTNETFEHQQRITEDALTVDPRTGDPVRRVIQPVGIAFKGSGFYVNDSRSSSAKGASASSEKATDTTSAYKATPDAAKSSTTTATETGASKASTTSTSSAAAAKSPASSGGAGAG